LEEENLAAEAKRRHDEKIAVAKKAAEEKCLHYERVAAAQKVAEEKRLAAEEKWLEQQ
jgi:hypothetical protein